MQSGDETVAKEACPDKAATYLYLTLKVSEGNSGPTSLE